MDFESIVVYFIAEKIQGNELKRHKDSGGEFHTGWKAARVGAVCAGILFAFIFSVAFIAGDLSNSLTVFDKKTYNSEIAKFVDNENKALAVFKVIDAAKPQYIVDELNKGKVLWEENKKITEKLDSITDLPENLSEKNGKLRNYCDLRIQFNTLLIKAISEDTDKYALEIQKVGNEINKTLEELK